MRSLRMLLTVTLAALALLLGSGAASAAPAPAASSAVSIEAAATADLQDLCAQFSTDYNSGSPTNPLSCWLPGATDPRCPTLAYPASVSQISAGLKKAAGTGVEHCIDLGFIDRNIKPSDGTGIVTAIFAKDLITWSANTGGNAVANLTDTDLDAIYTCNASLINSTDSGPVTWAEVGGTSTDRIVPVLPQTDSTTRSAWLADIGVTSPGSCVVDGTYNGNAIAENEGTYPVFTATGNPSGYKDVIVPFEGSAYVCQVFTKACPNVSGSLVLKDIDGKAPLTSADVLNVSGLSAFPATYLHGDYGLALNAGTAVAPKIPTIPIDLTKLLGQGNGSGWICGAVAQTDLKHFGFATVSNCGALTGQ